MLKDSVKQKIRNFIIYSKRFLKPRWLYLLLKRQKPLSQVYGLDRGQPIDRYYIENFLKENQQLVKGRVLEILDNSYTKKFGQDKIIQSDVLDIDQNNKNANIKGDLKNLQGIIDDNTYDCLILTQVLQFVDDFDSAIKECYRILKPNGVILATLPSISRIDCVAGGSGDYWRFTKASAKYALEKYFDKEKLEIKAHGNALVGLNFWIGAALEEMTKKQLDYNDQNFPCLITIKAIK